MHPVTAHQVVERAGEDEAPIGEAHQNQGRASDEISQHDDGGVEGPKVTDPLLNPKSRDSRTERAEQGGEPNWLPAEGSAGMSMATV